MSRSRAPPRSCHPGAGRACLVPLLLLLAVLLASGCVDEEADGGPSPSPSPARSPTPAPPSPTQAPPQRVDLLLDFGFEGCTGVTFEETHERAAVQALLPEGYTALETAPGQAAVRTELYTCDYTSAGFSLPDVVLGRVLVPVEAPEGAPEADHHAYLFRMIGGEDIFPTVWRQAGYDVHNGTANITVGAGAPVPALSATAVAGDYLIQAQGAPAADAQEGGFALHTQIEGGTLHWTGNVSGEAGFTGAGTMRWADDDPAAGLRTAATAGGALAFEARDHTGQDLWLQR